MKTKMETMWKINKILNFGKSGQFKDGYARLGFHDERGTQYVLAHDFNWVGSLAKGDRFHWTAGERQDVESDYHFDIKAIRPTYLSRCHDGSILVTAENGILELDIENKQAKTLVEPKKEGIEFIGNAVPDDDGSIWINDVCGYKIHRYSKAGDLIEIIGNGKAGFVKEDVSFQDASFNWMYDMRKGYDGNIYVLDSKNYAVRMLDLHNRKVIRIAGTDEPGYIGDGGDPLRATFGGNPNEHFDGPWSLALDEDNNIYVGDTQNHVLRMIDRKTNRIATIAGNPEVEPQKQNDPQEIVPFRLNLPKICGLDYNNGRIFIPEWDGDLVVLKRAD